MTERIRTVDELHPIRYHEDIERPRPDEDVVIAKIVAALR